MLVRFYIEYVRFKFPKVPGIQTQILDKLMRQQPSKSQQKQARNLLILDCREKAEIDVSRIPGSIPVHFDIANKDLEEFIHVQQKSLATPDSSLKLVSYCALGLRSAILTEKVLEVKLKILTFLLTSFTQTYLQILGGNKELAQSVKPLNLEGSIFKWANENRPMLDGNDSVTKFAHPVEYKYGVPYLKWNKWKWTR